MHQVPVAVTLAALLLTQTTPSPLTAAAAGTAFPPFSVVSVLTAVAPPAPRAPTARSGAQGWAVDLSGIDGDDTNVVASSGALTLAGWTVRAASAGAGPEQGSLISAPHRLPASAGLVHAALSATVPAGAQAEVDVRGQRDDGTWQEWQPAPARLAAPSTTVQVRLTLWATPGGDSPRIHALSLTAQAGQPVAMTAPQQPLTFDVFATREGLVGGTTANGHVIVRRDHFAALPSRRGLARRGHGEYSVRVCAANGRCAWAPVWDVGPWNTRDDYWNPAGVRQMWADLPRGLPQAQAAHRNGYNGGRDQYERRVRNPAGIDLADGTFWDALQLTDNSWVTVTYLWTGTGGGPTGTVLTQGGPLNVRDRPDTTLPAVGLAGNRSQVHVQCQSEGQSATGTQGSSTTWLRIGPGMYVSRAWVALPHQVPQC